MAKQSTCKKTEKLSVSEELALIQKRHKGMLDPADVVEFARDPSTALHDRFEWDNKIAADEYRLEQARRIIRYEMTIVETGDKDEFKTVRAFVSLTGDRRGGGYRGILDVLSDEDLRSQMLEEAKRDMIFFKNKYSVLKELAEVFKAMDKVL